MTNDEFIRVHNQQLLPVGHERYTPPASIAGIQILQAADVPDLIAAHIEDANGISFVEYDIVDHWRPMRRHPIRGSGLYTMGNHSTLEVKNGESRCSFHHAQTTIMIEFNDGYGFFESVNDFQDS